MTFRSALVSSPSSFGKSPGSGRDRVARLIVLAVPLLAFALLAGTFSNAVVRQLRVDVVDHNQTPTALTLVQATASAQGVTVARRSSDLDGAMHGVRSGDANRTAGPDPRLRDLSAVAVIVQLSHPGLVGKRPRRRFGPRSPGRS